MKFYENSGANLPYSRTFYHNCRIAFSFETACSVKYSFRIKHLLRDSRNSLAGSKKNIIYLRAFYDPKISVTAEKEKSIGVIPEKKPFRKFN